MLIQPYGSFNNVISPYSKVQECFVPHGHPCEHIVKHVAPALSAFVIDSRYKNKGASRSPSATYRSYGSPLDGFGCCRSTAGLIRVPWLVFGAVGWQPTGLVGVPWMVLGAVGWQPTGLMEVPWMVLGAVGWVLWESPGWFWVL